MSSFPWESDGTLFIYYLFSFWGTLWESNGVVDALLYGAHLFIFKVWLNGIHSFPWESDGGDYG